MVPPAMVHSVTDQTFRARQWSMPPCAAMPSAAPGEAHRGVRSRRPICATHNVSAPPAGARAGDASEGRWRRGRDQLPAPRAVRGVLRLVCVGRGAGLSLQSMVLAERADADGVYHLHVEPVECVGEAVPATHALRTWTMRPCWRRSGGRCPNCSGFGITGLRDGDGIAEPAHRCPRGGPCGGLSRRSRHHCRACAEGRGFPKGCCT